MVDHCAKFQIYDPNLGQDYVFFDYSTKMRFSSLERGFYVLEATGAIDWYKHCDIVLESILKTSLIGFFTVVPWYPGAGELKRTLLQKFKDAIEIDDSIYSYFVPSLDLLNTIFEIKMKYDGTSSGEWCIGGCLGTLAELKSRHSEWNLAYILRQPEKIGCVLSLEEMGQSCFMIRSFDGLQKIIDAITNINMREPCSQCSLDGM